AAGISVIKIREDGSKAPDHKTWDSYRQRLATPEEVQAWFPPHRTGLAAVGGGVSHHLEFLDFDSYETFLQYVNAAQGCDLKPLLDRLLDGYCERTPNGVHLPYHCAPVLGSTKLAQHYETDDYGRPLAHENGTPKIKTIIETKGEGGYVIIAPSHG